MLNNDINGDDSDDFKVWNQKDFSTDNEQQPSLPQLRIGDYTRIVYSLNVEDIQTVAEENWGRILTEAEIKIVEEHLPGYINWHDAIFLTILFNLELPDSSNEL